MPPGAKPEELRRLFENYGVVTECDIMNRCGFVHMQNPDMATSAIEALNNSNFKGATISVEPGRMKDRNSGGSGNGPRRSVPGGRGGGGAGDGGFRGNNQRGGGSGNRGENAMMGNRGNRDFGGGRHFNENVGGFNGSSGPMRRDNRGGNQRNVPYNRGGGGEDSAFGGRHVSSPSGRGFSNDRFDNRRSMDNHGGFALPNYFILFMLTLYAFYHLNLGLPSINEQFGGNAGKRFNIISMSAPTVGGNIGGGSFGMGNQDRRGFALPDRNLFSNNNINSGSVMFNERMSGGGGGRNGNGQGYERRPQGGSGINQFGGSHRYGAGNQYSSSSGGSGNEMFNPRG